MRMIDFAPLARSTVGFDRMVSLLQQTGALEQTDGFPPYNIEKTGETTYRITLAAAGFSPEELNIVTQEGGVVVTGRKAEDKTVQYLHHGLTVKSFDRRFNLADFIKVTGAKLENGLLSIELAREVPEALRPRTIEIAVGGARSAEAIGTAKAA